MKLNFIEMVNSKLIEEYKGSTCCRPMMKLFEHIVITDMRPKTNCIWDYRTDKCDPFEEFKAATYEEHLSHTLERVAKPLSFCQIPCAARLVKILKSISSFDEISAIRLNNLKFP